MAVVVFRDRQGAAHFDCRTCGRAVCVLVPPDDDPKCLSCRFVDDLPNVSDEERAALRRAMGLEVPA